MLHLEEWMDVKMLLNQGLSHREVARRTGHSRNTIARLASQGAPQPYTRAARASQLDPYKSYLTQRFEQYRLSAVRLLAEIRPMGYAGSIDLVRRYLATLRTEQRAHAKATFASKPRRGTRPRWIGLPSVRSPRRKGRRSRSTPS